MFVSGKYRSCAVPTCDSTSLTTVRESWDEQDGIYVGEQRCNTCGAGHLYSRKPSTPEEIAMAKRKSRGGGKRTRGGRVNTHPSNGSAPQSMEPAPARVTAGEAMRRAVAELGDLQVDNDLAPGQLQQIGQMVEEVERAKAEYANKLEAAKVAKKTLEGAETMLQKFCREVTHPKAMPLFDQKAAEDDLTKMVESGEASEGTDDVQLTEDQPADTPADADAATDTDTVATEAVL